MRVAFLVIGLWSTILGASSFASPPDRLPLPTGTHLQLVRRFYSAIDGLSSNSVSALAVSRSGVVRAAAGGQAARLDGDRWIAEPGPTLDRGNGMREEDPTLWLLPFWMGRYHRLIE
jgi:hypothetical protein